jgi:hypothetical protein
MIVHISDGKIPNNPLESATDITAMYRYQLSVWFDAAEDNSDPGFMYPFHTCNVFWNRAVYVENYNSFLPEPVQES